AVIGLVSAGRDMPLLEIRAQVAQSTVDERSYDEPAARVHRGKAARSGAPKETQQESFGLVVTRMSKRDHIRVEPYARAREKGMTRGARGILDRATIAPRQGRHVGALGDERPAEGLGQSRRERFVAIGRIAELMVEVSEAS